MEGTHDNENDTWTALGLAAARVLEACKHQKENGERDAGRGDKDEEKAKQHREAVEHGLNHIAAFEERASGKAVRIRRKKV
jgi:hypothetical protein